MELTVLTLFKLQPLINFDVLGSEQRIPSLKISIVKIIDSKVVGPQQECSSRFSSKYNDNELESLDLKNDHNALMTGGITNYDGNMIYLEGMNSMNNPLLSCIQVDSEDEARAGLSPYDSWLKDDTTSYAEDCEAFLGIEEERMDQSVKLYPNPARHSVAIECDSHELEQVIIYSVLGTVVKRVYSNFDQIDLSGIAPGVYIFRIHLEDELVIKRGIKR